MEKKRTKEIKYLLNLGYKPISWDNERYIETQLQDGEFPEDDILMKFKHEVWVDVEDNNKRIIVLVTEMGYYS